MTTGVPIVRAAGEGEKLWFFGGGTHTWKATTADTGGAFFLFEDSLSESKTTPLHCHPDADEMLYLLDGDIVLQIDGAEHQLGRGGMALAPRGVPHAFMVTSREARLLTLHTPGNAEAFFREASEPTGDDHDSRHAVDFPRVLASAERNGGTAILGPPPFLPADADRLP
jgi:quercetin dioxygenase-like cupin family protein